MKKSRLPSLRSPIKNFLLTLSLVTAGLLGSGISQSAEKNLVHGISDLAHEFSFYADGRFKQQYLQDHKVVTSWGNLYDMDDSNANLIILLGCDSHLTYTPKDIKYLKNFMSKGGAVLILGGQGDNPQNKLAQQFGAMFDQGANPPLKATNALDTDKEIEGRPGSTLKFEKPGDWTPLITDGNNQAVLALKKMGKGKLIIGARSLAGSNPNAKDNINASWWTPLLEKAVAGKKVDPRKPLHGKGLTDMGNTETVDGIVYHYSDYLEPTFRAMTVIQAKCRPAIEKRMGVPLSDGMASSIGLLATGGGGFSSGHNIGLAVFWGDFPAREDGMIEFITHETVHSWVLPHPEVWNEPIATYVGNLVMQDLGHAEEGKRRIANQINRAARLDETMTKYDLDGESRVEGAKELNGGERNDIHWGKTYWIFEELHKMDPDFMAKYFQTKRKFVPAKLDGRYDLNLTVAVISKALNKNMFPWFKEHGMDVDQSKVTIQELKID